MKSPSLLMALMVLLASAAIGQQNVYPCLPWEAPISASQTFPAGTIFKQNCIKFAEPTQYLYQVSHDIDIEAKRHIIIEPGFRAGQMLTNGSMLLRLAQQPTGYDIFLMSGNSMFGLPRYKKVEFAVKLAPALHNRIEAFVHPSTGNTATPLNPYLESKLDVQMIFTHESGLQRKVDAFYFQDFARNTTTNDWDELPTEHPMRVRFTPHLNGKWTVTTSIKVENVPITSLLQFAFEVVESGKPGFVSVHPNNRNLQRNNQIIYPVGTNFSSPYNGVDVWSSTPAESNKAAKVDDWLSYQQNVIDYAGQGGKFIRTLQSAYSSLIEFENLGDYTNRLHYAWEQDKLLENCEVRDVLIQFNLMQQEPLMKYANFDMSRWDFGHWNMDGTVNTTDIFPHYCYYTYPLKEPREMFTDPVDMEFHKQRTRYYISRYGYSTQIYEWELVNEPFHLGERWQNGGSNDNGHILTQADKDAVENYHETLADYIKYGLGHVNHLVGINNRMSLDVTIPANTSNLDQSIFHPSIDIFGTNPYQDAPEKLVISKSPGNRLDVEHQENTAYGRNHVIHQEISKPVIFSEIGHVHNSCSNYAGHFKDVMSLGFAGAAGFSMWNGQFIDPANNMDETSLWPSTIRAQQHMNGLDMIFTLASDGSNSGLWQQGREHSNFDGYDKIKEHQFYVSNDGLRAMGYIYNRTYNVFTAQNAVGCAFPVDPFANPDHNSATAISWDPDVMKIDGLLPDRWYTIDYYTFRYGNYMVGETQCLESSLLGKLDLVHPHMMTTDNPVVWYVVKRNDCNDGKRSDQEASGNPALEPASSLSLSMHPNPNSGVFNLQIEAGEGQAVSLKIFNMLGQQVYFNDHVTERQLTLDTGLEPGIYLIKVADGKNEQTKKFVVQ